MHKDSAHSQVLFSNEDKAKDKDSSDKDLRHRNPYLSPYPRHWNTYPSPSKTKLASVLNLTGVLSIITYIKICLYATVKVSI